MKKVNIMSAVLGLVVGLVIGFVGANSFNKSEYQKQPAQGPSSTASNSNPALPPDHPPLGTSSGDQPHGGPRPEVMAAIEKAKAQPQNYEAQMTAADLYYQIQRFDEAARFYEAASKLRPNDKEVLVKAGNAYFDAAETERKNDNQQAANTKFDQAEKWYTQALALDPKDFSVRTDLGLTFFLREPQYIDRAIKEYKTSLSLDPGHAITLQNLAIAYGEKGDNENFQLTVEKLKKIDPDNPVVTKSEEK